MNAKQHGIIATPILKHLDIRNVKRYLMNKGGGGEDSEGNVVPQGSMDSQMTKLSSEVTYDYQTELDFLFTKFIIENKLKE